MSQLQVSASPHIHNGSSTPTIMRDVVIALVPAIIASGIIFGPRALLLIAVTVAACVISEYLSRKILKRSNSIRDLTAVITGILLALNLPVSLPLWMAALGGVIAIVIVKQFSFLIYIDLIGFQKGFGGSEYHVEYQI
ncbi:RnfABCDGE type electron transport complex subunit D [Enterococcus sp. LJL120]